MRPARAVAAALVVAGCVAAGSAAIAQPADDPQELEALRARFKEGLRLEEEGRWAEALAAFEEISRSRHTAAVAFHVALCHENLGNLARAAEGYERAGALAKAEGDNAADVAEKAERRLAAVRGKVPELVVVLAPDDTADVLVDGRVLPRDDVGAPIPMDPGLHRVEVRRGGDTRRVKEVDLAPGARVTVRVPPPRSESAAPDPVGPVEPPAEASRGTKAPAIVVGSIGLGALVASGVLLGLRQAAIDEVEATCTAELDRCDPDKQDVADRGQAYHFAAIGLAAGGAACLGVAVALWFTVGADGEPSNAKKPPKQAELRFQLRPGGAALVGTF